MELYDFNRHNQVQRAALVYEQGQFLLLRCQQPYHIGLYHMGAFFAEIWYQVENNQVDLVRGFKSPTRLQPYLELIDLSEIVPE